MSRRMLIKAIRNRATLSNLNYLKSEGLQKLVGVTDVEQADIDFFEGLIDLQILKLTAESVTDVAMYEAQIEQYIKDNTEV